MMPRGARRTIFCSWCAALRLFPPRMIIFDHKNPIKQNRAHLIVNWFHSTRGTFLS